MKYLTTQEYDRLLNAQFVDVDMILIYKNQSHYYSDTIYCLREDTKLIVDRLKNSYPTQGFNHGNYTHQTRKAGNRS